MSRRNVWAVLALVLAMVVSACAGADDSTADAAGADDGADASEVPADDGADDGGGEDDGGDGPSGEPIVIGVANPANGPSAFPQSGYGAEAAEHYVNEVLGGIDGRPLELDICDGDSTPETAVNCANEFVADDVVAVFDAYDPGAASMHPILADAGIPMVGLLAGQSVSDVAPAPEAFYFSGPLETSALGSMTILHEQGHERLALALQDSPAAHGYVDNLMIPIGEEFGMTLTPVYTDVTSMNFSVLAASELADDPDVTGIISLPEDGCTGLFQELRAQGWEGPIFAGSCSQFIDEMGEDAAGIIIQPRLWLPGSEAHAPEEIQEELAAFAESMTAVGYEGEQSARSVYSFGGVINMANIIAEMDGEVTAETFGQAMTEVEDFDSFLGPDVTCDHAQWPGKAACSKESIFFEVQPDGTLMPVGGEGFIELDPSVLEEIL